MNNMLEYRGYHTKIEYDSESMVLHGKIEFISDLVTFESEKANEIEKEFHDAVDDYLEFCAEVGKEPDKEFKGTFNVRITPDLHKKAAVAAMDAGITLNQFVSEAIIEKVDDKKAKKEITILLQPIVKKFHEAKVFSIDEFSCIGHKNLSYGGTVKYGS